MDLPVKLQLLLVLFFLSGTTLGHAQDLPAAGSSPEAGVNPGSGSLAGLFAVLLREDPDGLDLERLRVRRQAARDLAGLDYPALSLSGKLSPGLELSGTLAAASPALVLPLELSLDFALPLLETSGGLARELAACDASLAGARLAEYRRQAWAGFLRLMAGLAKAEALVALRDQQAAEYRALRVLAERRLALGAGSRKDVLRATLADSQAAAAALGARQLSGRLGSGWGSAVQDYLDAHGGLGSFVQPLAFLEICRSAGLDLAARLAPAESGQPALDAGVPAARTPGSVELEIERYRIETDLASLPEGTALGLQASLGLALDAGPLADGGDLEWAVTAGVGLDFNLALAGQDQDAGLRKLRLEEIRDRQAQLADREAARQRAVVAAAASLADAVRLYQSRLAAMTLADTYEAALRAELTAGGSTLETLIQGLQVVHEARESLAEAYWDTLTAALDFLDVAGLPDLPEGTRP